MNDTLPPATAPSAAPQSRRLRCIALVAALAKNGVIGVNNRLPWRLPEDLQRFRALTTGHTIIMGRRTWESIGRPLPGRQNIVVSRQRDFAPFGAEVAACLDAALALATLPDPVFVIGGEALYRDALPMATRLYFTEIERDFAGDAHFPEFSRASWREIARETRRTDGRDGFGFDFAEYERLPEQR
ncbi:MAG: dihydrofolate reductase [Casimicrobiaceae bacterium]